MKRLLFLFIISFSMVNTHALAFNFYHSHTLFESVGELNKITLDKYKGTYSIVTIAYSECKSICTFTIKNLKAIEKYLEKNHPTVNKNINFIIITLDPKTDNLIKLKKYKNNVAKNKKNWFFLRTSLKETRDLVSKFEMGFENRSAAGAHIMHSSKIVLISPQGHLLGQYNGPSSQVSKIQALLSSLDRKKEHSPSK